MLPIPLGPESSVHEVVDFYSQTGVLAGMAIASVGMTLNDIAWLLFIAPVAPFIIQNVAIGVAILDDKRQTLPRWVAYINFWLAVTTYAVFLVVMGVMLNRAIKESAGLDGAERPVAAA